MIIKQTLWSRGLEIIPEKQAPTAMAHSNYWELTVLFSAKYSEVKNEKKLGFYWKKNPTQPNPLSKCLNVDENTAF